MCWGDGSVIAGPGRREDEARSLAGVVDRGSNLRLFGEARTTSASRSRSRRQKNTDFNHNDSIDAEKQLDYDNLKAKL